MRRIYITIFVVVLIGVYWFYNHTFFVQRNMENYTGLTKYTIEEKYYDQEQSYMKVSISLNDKQKLLSKFSFTDEFELKLLGKVNQNFIYKNPKFIYYIINKGIGQYRYIIMALEKEGDVFELYEFYGN